MSLHLLFRFTIINAHEKTGFSTPGHENMWRKQLCTGQKKMSNKETRLFPTGEGVPSGKKSRVSSRTATFCPVHSESRQKTWPFKMYFHGKKMEHDELNYR
ncbi:Uncharacterized protein dnm_041200 [Desulfonema magnum]|uniref:Uncharacterized protein n=1 Tax=Desulfonema magnum TaxID=45655 RepID=A0A975GNS4_9BACT|nr:Uncharacterized protein dnm_041200 [Desulfonema magnum]